ncbi:MAG: trigger factor [Thermodesulfobacteriota bacterium]
MEYNVEDLSPVKKKVTVKVPAEEVNSSLTATTAFFKKDLKMSGFRKGKVPSSVVENKFKKEISQQAGQDLLNVHFNQIFGEMGVQPLAGVDVDAGTMERDKDYEYSFSFEFLPELDLPEYYGLKAQQKKVDVGEDAVERTIYKIQQENSTLQAVKEDRSPEDGDVAVIDFAAYQNGEKIEGIEASGFELPLGEGQSLEEFESKIKGLTPGASGEQEITLPEDFISSELAGQTVSMSVTLNSIKERVLPEVDEKLAEQVGNFDSAEQMRDKIKENIYNYLYGMEKSKAQNELLEQLKSQVEVTPPESLVQSQLDSLLQNKKERLEKQGKSLEAEGGEDKVREELRQEAEDLVRSHVILLSIANKEGMTVSDQEIQQHIINLASRNNQDPKSLLEYFENNNMMYALRDSLLADKAMEHIYNHAEIEEVEGDTQEEEEAEAEAPDSEE